MATSDPFERLTTLRIGVPHEARERQLAAILEAVRSAPPVRTPRRLGFRRRWAVAIASLTAVVAPVGTAVAAEGALPGELLYPVKTVSENVRGVFDNDLVATHRVEELERLLDLDADAGLVADTADRAEAEVAELDDPGELGPRLERARERLRLRVRQAPGAGAGIGTGPSGETPGGPGVDPGGPTAPAGPIDSTDQPPPPGTGDPVRNQNGDGDGSGPGGTTTPPSSGGGSRGQGGSSGGGAGGGGGSGDGAGDPVGGSSGGDDSGNGSRGGSGGGSGSGGG